MALNFGYNRRHLVFGTTSQGSPGSSGPQGPQGPQGPTGSPGSDGSPGPRGSTGPAGSTGPKGTTGSRGPDGTAGSDGSDGSPGAQGSTGPAGSTGPKGSTGSRGSKGPRGWKGNDGSPGPTGPAGSVGPKGDTGNMASISSDLDMNSNKIINLTPPTDTTDASTKGYVDTQIQAKISHDGSTAMSADLDMNTHKIIKLGDPSVGDDASNKSYVDQEVAVVKAAADEYTQQEFIRKLSLDGSTPMTGSLNMNSNLITNVPTAAAAGDAANKKYVDDQVHSGYNSGNKYTNDQLLKVLPLNATRTMTGNLNVGSNRIINMATPTADTDASTKKYVDDNSSSILGSDGSLNMKFKKVRNLGDPTSIEDATTKWYVDTVAVSKVSSDGSTTMTGSLNMNTNKIINLATPTIDTDASTKKYVDDNVGTPLDLSQGLNMGSKKITSLGAPTSDADATTKKYTDDLTARKLSLDGSTTMTGNLKMGKKKITNLGTPTGDGDATNKKYVDSKTTVSPTDLSKYVSVDKTGYKPTYDGGTHKAFTFITSGWNKPYNQNYGSNMVLSIGAEAVVPVVGTMTSFHIEQDPFGVISRIIVSMAMPNSYWNAGKTQGMVFAIKSHVLPSGDYFCKTNMGNSMQDQDLRSLGIINGYQIFLARINYSATDTPVTVIVDFKFSGTAKTILDLYAGFVFDGITQARYDNANLTTNLYYPTHPMFDTHKFIDSTYGDILVAGVLDIDGTITIPKLLVKEGNVDTSSSSWLHKSFTTDIPLGSIVRGVNTFTYHRMVLPPAKRITLIVMSVDGNTVLDDDMVFELSAKFYVGGGASTTGKLTDITKATSSGRCEGVTFLNRDIVVALPSFCIGFEMFMRQTNTTGKELNKKITLLVQVHSE